MAAELDQLAKYHAERGNQPRANLYSALAAEERANGGPESVASASVDASLVIPAVLEIPPVLTPESITTHWRDRWVQWGERIGAKYDIPDLRLTPDQLAEIYQGGRKIVCVPKKLTTAEGLVDLGRMFPDMKSWATSEGTSVKSDQSKGGYLAVEASIDSPNLGSDEKTLRNLFKAQGRKGMNLSTYIVASQDSKLETGQYFDERATWSRLPGSRYEGDVVHAYFFPDGSLYVTSHLDSQGVHPTLGGRSQEAIGA